MRIESGENMRLRERWFVQRTEWGPIDYNIVSKDHPDYDPKKVGPEVDVRWRPSMLRYGYPRSDLEWAVDVWGKRLWE